MMFSPSAFLDDHPKRFRRMVTANSSYVYVLAIFFRRFSGYIVVSRVISHKKEGRSGCETMQKLDHCVCKNGYVVVRSLQDKNGYE